MSKVRLIFIFAVITQLGCSAQTDKKMSNKDNPLLCDPETGVCETPDSTSAGHAETSVAKAQDKPVKIIYFTDPICSSCWGIEPQLRKLKLEYGNNVEIEYHMGGLLKDWSYNSGGISQPSDVASHWDEVSGHYDMPIDGDVWLEDPLPSSYPPSIAFKAAQIQNEEKAIEFLRRIREMVFLEKKNITKWEHLNAAATEVGLDTARLKKDFNSSAKNLFDADLSLGRALGVRGFPTILVSSETSGQQLVYGFRPYESFETAILKVYPEAKKNEYEKSWTGLFKKYPTLTTREFSELSGTSKQESIILLDQLTAEGHLVKFTTKNGILWSFKEV